MITSIYDEGIKRKKVMISTHYQDMKKYTTPFGNMFLLLKTRKLKETTFKILKDKFNININWAYTPLLHLQTFYKNQVQNKGFSSNRRYCKQTFSPLFI